MRRILALAVSVLLATPVLAQGPALKAASAARNAAMRAGDGKGWAKYTTDDFMVTSATGVVKNKEQRTAEIEGHPLTGTAVQPTDEKWRSYGNTVVYTAAITSADNKPQRITTVWVRQGRTWRVAAVHVTEVAPAAPSP